MSFTVQAQGHFHDAPRVGDVVRCRVSAIPPMVAGQAIAPEAEVYEGSANIVSVTYDPAYGAQVVSALVQLQEGPRDALSWTIVTWRP